MFLEDLNNTTLIEGYPYQVPLTKSNGSLLWADDPMVQWLDETIGAGKWNYKNYSYSTGMHSMVIGPKTINVICFKDKDDAALFKLMWG